MQKSLLNRLNSGGKQKIFSRSILKLLQTASLTVFLALTIVLFNIHHSAAANHPKSYINEQFNPTDKTVAYIVEQFIADPDGNKDNRKQQLITYNIYADNDTTTIITKQNIIRGSMILHMLQTKIGEAAFSKGLQKFVVRNKVQPQGFSELKTIFNKVTDLSLKDFFTQWGKQTDLLHLEVKNITIEEVDGQSMLSFQLLQKQNRPYTFNVQLFVTTPKAKIKKAVRITDRRTDIKLATSFPPTKLVIDPDYNLLRRLALNELPPVWGRFIMATDKLAIIAASQETIFKPLTDYLASMGSVIIKEEDVSDTEMADGSIIFLGTDSKRAKSIFAGDNHSASGFTLDVRHNPLNPQQIAVLVSAATKTDIAYAMTKLTAYQNGFALHQTSYFHIQDGYIRQQTTQISESGILHVLDIPPVGVQIAHKLTLDDIIKKIKHKQVIHVGETHTRNEDHILQLRIIRGLHHQNSNLAIGMEMFPASSQPALDDYIAGRICEWEFLRKSRYFKHWGFDYRLYRDIINFARRHHIPVIGLNLEREIVSKVFRGGGLSALSEEERAKIPLDMEFGIKGFRQRVGGVFFAMHDKGGSKPRKINYFLQAQIVRDEVMAEAIVSYLIKQPSDQMVVIAGQGHTVKNNGIPPRISRRMPMISQTVILNSQPVQVGQETADFLIFSQAIPLPPKPLLGTVLADTVDGVTIRKLSPDSKAGAAGVKAQDIILAINDEPVHTIEDLKIVMFFKEKGDNVRLRIVRPRDFFTDQRMEISMTL